MHQFTLILLLSLLLPDVYIYLVYIVKCTRRITLRAIYWLPTFVLCATYFYFLTFGGENALAHHTHGIGRMAVAIMLFAVPKILFMLTSVTGILCRGIGRLLSKLFLGTPFRQPIKPFVVHATPFITIGGILAIISCGCILYGGTLGISHFEVKHVEIKSPRLPSSFDGFKIVQLSDLHIGSWEAKDPHIDQLVELVNRQQADLIAFTGDLVNQRSIELEPFQAALSRLSSRRGIYSVLGNHDYGTYYHWSSIRDERNNLERLIESQRLMGWNLLNNTHVMLHAGNDSIALIGVENDGEPPFSQHADLSLAARGTESVYSILLSHNPTHWRREILPNTNIDLTLSGHTHAMQMEVANHSLSSLRYPEWSGLYTEGNRALYVNVGIGYVGLPFRFGAWPEITVITLRKS